MCIEKDEKVSHSSDHGGGSAKNESMPEHVAPATDGPAAPNDAVHSRGDDQTNHDGHGGR